MDVRQLLQLVRNTLQDQEKNFWDDSELLTYYQEARRVLASERTEKQQTQTVLLDTNTSTYNPVNVLRYVAVDDNEGNDRLLYPDDGTGEDDDSGIIVVDYNEIFVNNPDIGTELYVAYIGLPEVHNLNDTVRSGDENAIKYYILSKAYEKEHDMQNFAKADKFETKFDNLLVKLKQNVSVNYSNKRVRTTKGYFF
jgi:hypothetical protein